MGGRRRASSSAPPSRSIKRYFAGTHRIADPGDIVARVRPLCSRLGITRVADVTGLDHLAIPCVMVVRPASRNLSVMQGKGQSREAALASGFGEALESFCAERIVAPARFDALENVAHDPAFLVPTHHMREGVTEARDGIPWTLCANLLDGARRFVPSELVFADFTTPAPQGQGRFNVSTNGLAAGSCREEALLHGLCELIERDALALWMVRWEARKAAPPLDPATLPDDASRCGKLVAQIESAGLDVALYDITSDIGVPAFLCAVDDRRSGAALPIGRIVGSGCHPSASVALSRAITEAAQARLTIIVGARDDLSLNFYRMMQHNALFAAALPYSAPARCGRFEDRSFATEDIAGDLDLVLRRFAERGIDTVLAADLPCPVEGASCVRVIAPDLESLFEKAWYRPGARAAALAQSLG